MGYDSLNMPEEDSNGNDGLDAISEDHSHFHSDTENQNMYHLNENDLSDTLYDIDDSNDDNDDVDPMLDESLHIGTEKYQDENSGIVYLPTYDPNSGSQGVVGDVGDQMEHWEYQGDTNECAIFSQMFALEELTGKHYDSEELVEVAEENGWFHNGTTQDDVGNILEFYGMDVDKSTGGTVDDIEAALGDGKQVIVALDSGEVWEQDGSDMETLLEDFTGMPGSDADHAVQVIGIDRSDPDNPMVILNDSGHPGGKGEMVALDVFQGAWEDSGNFMVVASNGNGGTGV